MSKREDIVNSTYEILSKKGISNVTVHEIAERAGVNIAAINYYFGSKEKLIDKVVEKYIKEASKLFALLEESEEDPAKKIKDFAMMLVELSTYNFYRTMIFQAIGEDDIMPGIMDSFKTHFDVAKGIIQELTGINDNKELIFKTMQFYSNLNFPMLLSHYTSQVTGFDFSQDMNKEQYVDKVIKLLF